MTTETNRDLLTEVAAERRAEREVSLKAALAEKLEHAEAFLTEQSLDRTVITFTVTSGRRGPYEHAALFVAGHWHLTGAVVGSRYTTEGLAELFVRRGVDLTKVEVLRTAIDVIDAT